MELGALERVGILELGDLALRRLELGTLELAPALGPLEVTLMFRSHSDYLVRNPVQAVLYQ